MFLYVFYIGGTALVAAVSSCAIITAYNRLDPRFRCRSGSFAVGMFCVALMIALPYGGYASVERSRHVTERNNEFSTIEQAILRMDFDRSCTFEGHLVGDGTPPSNSFPCVERQGIRIVKTPNRTGLRYFVLEEGTKPVRWKGMVDYPIPFSFSKEPRLLSPTLVRRAFLTGATFPRRQPTRAAMGWPKSVDASPV